jgi:VWFA-related protein
MSKRRDFRTMCIARASWRFLLLLVTGLSAAQGHAQESKNPQQPQGEDEVITVKSRVVNTDVMVVDKKGKQITDLKAEDFVVYENGVQQQVEFFEAPLVKSEPGKPPAANDNARPAGTGPAPGATPRNIISLVLDGLSTEQTNLKPVREGAIKYIRERVGESDGVAVFAVTGGLKLLQPYTNNKEKLISVVENAYSSAASSKNFEQRDIAATIEQLREISSSVSGPVANGPGAGAAGSAVAEAMSAMRTLQAFLKLRSALSLQQSRPILAALAAICEGLRNVPGKKTLVLFSQGFVTPAVLDWQVQSTIDLANRANVAIYIIDSAGLRGGGTRSGAVNPIGPLGAVSGLAEQEQRIQASGGENVFDQVRHEGQNREYDILYRISEDSGGKFIKGTNDIAKGLDRMDQEIRSRYTLGYHSTDSNFDGSFRKLKFEVRRPGAQVISRAGFYAVANDEVVPLSPEEKKLLTSFATAEASPSLPISVDAVPFRSREGYYLIPLSLELPLSAVKFEQKENKQRMELDVLGVVREAQDRVLFRLGGKFEVAVAADKTEAALKNNLFYRQDVELAPGAYNIDLIVRDKLSGKLAAKREKILLPEASAEFSSTGVVLSRRVESARAPQGAQAVPADVLSDEGVLIRPSPSREFRAADNLVVFFQLYNATNDNATGKPLVMVTVTLTKDGKAVTKPVDYRLNATQTDPVPHLTFARHVSLSGLPAGQYTAMINVRDMVALKLIKHQVTFVIVP